METRLSSQLSKREQEIIALQARMQASYQDHVAQTQSLNSKVSFHTQTLESIYIVYFCFTSSVFFETLKMYYCSLIYKNVILQILTLQDQLEKGPNAQLARLQQENSILRDALNQATSQAESKWVF